MLYNKFESVCCELTVHISDQLCIGVAPNYLSFLLHLSFFLLLFAALCLVLLVLSPFLLSLCFTALSFELCHAFPLTGLEIIMLHCWMAKLHQKTVLCPGSYSTYTHTPGLPEQLLDVEMFTQHTNKMKKIQQVESNGKKRCAGKSVLRINHFINEYCTLLHAWLSLFLIIQRLRLSQRTQHKTLWFQLSTFVCAFIGSRWPNWIK